MADPVVDVEDLWVTYHTLWGPVAAVRGVSLEVGEGECLGVVGESGSGKSTLGLAVLRLLPPNAVVRGRVVVGGVDVYSLPPSKLRGLRGRLFSAVFQDPQASLNPSLTVGEQLGQIASSLYPGLGREERRKLVIGALREVMVPDPERVARSYPWELSGGMQQRVVIAAAILGRPKLLLADEPTTQLDVTIQAQILSLLDKLRMRHRMSLILITHNLGIVANLCSRAAVMYAGKLVELAPVEELLENPLHPYTRGLLASIPRLRRREPLKPIPGEPVDPRRLPPGCPFHPRCTERLGVCSREDPGLYEAGPGHLVSCWLYAPGRGGGSAEGAG